MIAKGKAIQHGFAMLNYVLEKDKAKPIRFNNIQHPLTPQDVWLEMQLHRALMGASTRNSHQLKCDTLRFEISPQNKETEGWTDDDYRALLDELNQEMKNLNYDPNTGEQVHNFDLDNTQYIAAIHYDSQGGIRHIHVVANRVDMDGHVIDDHYLGKRILAAVHAINLRHGWVLPEDIHEEHLQQINEACMEALAKMKSFSWEQYGYELAKKGLRLKTRKDSNGKVVSYNIMMGNSKFKASILGISRNLTAAKIEKTWAKLHAPVSPSVNSETSSKPKTSDSESSKEKGAEQSSGQRTMQIPELPRPAMFHDEYKVNGKSIPISIPEDAYNIIKTEAETLFKEAESTAEVITQTAALLFLGYVDAAVSLAGLNGGSAVPPTAGGGGSGSGSGWGKDPKEDEREWALRCAHQAAAMCKPTPRRRFRR